MSSTALRAQPAELTRAEKNRVLMGTLVGTTIEWYDFIIYAQAAGLVFAHLFFAPAGSDSTVAQLVSWATLGVSFLVRPLGGIAAGHFGDRYGRRAVLVATLLMMGGATTAIGFLPTYDQIGVWAPVILVLLRILQGFSAGGEWGGAALMAVEHAPRGRRGAFGAYPQLGVPAGLILATSVIAVVTAATTTEQFVAWGWRIPFLVSVVLIGVGYIIRRSVAESPVFAEIAERRRESSPLATLFRTDIKSVLLVAFIFLGVNAAGYMLIAFFASFAIRGRGFDSSTVLLVTSLGAASWLGFTLWGGRLSDRLGRVRTTQFGYVLIIAATIPLFAVLDTAETWLFATGVVLYSVGNGFAYGPLSAMFAEMFPAQLRFSGISIGYAIGAILGGAFAPLVAESLLETTGSTFPIGLYIAGLCLVSLIAVSFVREPSGRDLFQTTAHETSKSTSTSNPTEAGTDLA
jgi:MFS family permease